MDESLIVIFDFWYKDITDTSEDVSNTEDCINTSAPAKAFMNLPPLNCTLSACKTPPRMPIGAMLVGARIMTPLRRPSADGSSRWPPAPSRPILSTPFTKMDPVARNSTVELAGISMESNSSTSIADRTRITPSASGTSTVSFAKALRGTKHDAHAIAHSATMTLFLFGMGAFLQKTDQFPVKLPGPENARNTKGRPLRGGLLPIFRSISEVPLAEARQTS